MKAKHVLNRLNYSITAMLLLFFGGNISLQAQIDYSDFLPGGETRPYMSRKTPTNKVVPYPLLGESDVKFSRRVVRCIDTRQKMNKQLEWPRQPLNALLYAGLSEGAIIAYRSDSLLSYYTSEEISMRGRIEVVGFRSTDSIDPTIGIDTVFYVDLDYTKIRKFWIMEDWVFDYKRSVFTPRIIAIAPIFSPEYGGIQAREQPLCWIRMDDIRQLLTNTEMFNRYNDAARLSYDDFFQMRIFDSYIIYESNVFDNYVNQFQEYENDGIAALLKSDEIKNDLFIFEHDLWQF
jgi:gliding motility associated protien GldN